MPILATEHYLFGRLKGLEIQVKKNRSFMVSERDLVRPGLSYESDKIIVVSDDEIAVIHTMIPGKITRTFYRREHINEADLQTKDPDFATRTWTFRWRE